MLHPSITKHLPEIERILRSHHVTRAYAFGSAVKGTFGPESDFDLLVAFQEGLDPVAYGTHYLEALYELQGLLGREVELVAEETLRNPYFIQSVENSKMLLYDR